MGDSIYFSVANGTPARDILESYNTAIKKHRLWVKAFAKRHGLDDAQWIGREQLIIGFQPPKPADKKSRFWEEEQKAWREFLTAHPLWRREKTRSCDYIIPRRCGQAAKALNREWTQRPRPLSAEHIGVKLTGVAGFDAWMEGMTRHYPGWAFRTDDSAVVAIPYCVTKAKSWKPAEGMVRGDQDALRDEYHALQAKKD